MRRGSRIVGAAAWLAAVIIFFNAISPASAQDQLTPEQAAILVLNSARAAYNEQKYPFAAERFREFLRAYAAHAEAPAAQYGLALALLGASPKDYPGVIAALGQVVGREDFADRPFALYYTGAAWRGQGGESLALAEARPPEAVQHRATAAQRFEEAAKQFAAAAAAFAARVKTPPAPDAAKLPDDLEWAVRSRCDQCEMLLRVNKAKEALDLAEAVRAEPTTSKSQYRDLVLYQLGYACFALGDYTASGRALSRLAPFNQEFGVHARYLLARTHHLAGERPEAAALYKAVLAGYEEQKKAAQQSLATPAVLAPEQREFLEALVKDPPPDYVPRAMFYGALLLAEESRYADALVQFAALAQQHPKCTLLPEAQFRQGFCQMQLKNFPEAAKLLQPLCAHPQLGDQALLWLGRTQAAAADPKNPPAYQQALAGAMTLMRQAADRAGQLVQTDPGAKVRRGDGLLELADTMQLAGQYKEAAATYGAVLTENNNPDRAEETLQRQATAFHLAGMYKESDDTCAKFEKAYPASTLLAAVLFRAAENAYLTASSAAANPALPNREPELARLYGEAITRYARLIDRYPGFAYVNLARQGTGMALYQLGRYADAAATLALIPQADRTGDLAGVPYLMADCYLRGFPPETDDALAAARLVDRAERAAKLLEQFLGAQGTSPQAPDALLKLGHCYQRIAAALADPEERKKQLALARGAYERLMQQFAADALVPVAVFERAKCMALQGEVDPAMGELGRFMADPFRQSPVAPLALLRFSTLLRSRNKAADAANIMAQCRAQHEANLLKDPARSGWVPLLQYEHALAVKESGKLADARAMFEALATQFANHEESANALWRAGQCRREELAAQLAAARAAASRPGAPPPEVAAAEKAVTQAQAALREALEPLQTIADSLGRKEPGSPAHLRMLYEVAWCSRTVAEADVEGARRQLAKQRLAEVQARLATKLAPGQAPPALLAPEVPLSTVSMRLAEKMTHDLYRRLIAAGPGTPLAGQARFELAEMLLEREDRDGAIKLLAEALTKSPPLDLAERIRLRLADGFLAANDPKSALPHIEVVARNAASPLAAQARYLAGAARSRQQDWAKAIEQFVPFRDQPPLQNVPGVSDRALLALGQAYAKAGQWDASRQAFEVLTQRFPQSTCLDEALYGMAWAWQNQKQHDNAVGTYARVIARTAGEVAARSQLQIGLCRMEQKRYPEAENGLLAAAFTYDYPECTAQAWCEAARVRAEMKEPAGAAKLLRQVIESYPESPWAEVARQRMAEMAAIRNQ